LNHPKKDLENQTLIFAGGITTKKASHFISGLTASLAKKGAKIGIQIGTAYLFTKEIIETNALQKVYQEIIKKEKKTIVIGNTVGLYARTIASPFSQKTLSNEHEWIKQGMPLSERKEAFEKKNIGSLLVAAKAFDLTCFDENGEIVCYFNDDEQYQNGNYMVGDSLAFE
jgi:NAD(P)H-dependent flavin oxidoreductase YrpB (nitropropane dioxygenase family)